MGTVQINSAPHKLNMTIVGALFHDSERYFVPRLRIARNHGEQDETLPLVRIGF